MLFNRIISRPTLVGAEESSHWSTLLEGRTTALSSNTYCDSDGLILLTFFHCSLNFENPTTRTVVMIIYVSVLAEILLIINIKGYTQDEPYMFLDKILLKLRITTRTLLIFHRISWKVFHCAQKIVIYNI